MTDPAPLPDERPQQRREYSGAGSTLGVAALVIAAVALLIWYFEFRGGSTPPGRDDAFGVIDLAAADNPTGRPPSAEPGRAAPNFVLQVPGGGQAELTDWRGSYVLLNFWASWCGPCRGEAPALQALHDRSAGKLAVVGVNIQETDSAALGFTGDFDITYPVVMDRDGEVTTIYRSRTPPTSVLVAPDGTILRVYVGALAEQDIVELEQEYLAE